MRKGLVLLIFVLVFFVGACGEDDGNCSGLFSSYEAGLCWSSLSLDSLSWFSASSYCEDIGGRLPSIVELRSLVINCDATVYPEGDKELTLGWCPVSDSCLSGDCAANCGGCDFSDDHSVFGDVDRLWSSSRRSDFQEYVWVLYFNVGAVGTYPYDRKSYFRCVQ